MNISFEKVDSIYEMECLIDRERIVFCDETQNTFLIICFDNNRAFGIAYFDYGIKPGLYYSINYRNLYLGFGIKFIAIDITQKKMLINDSLKSVFYEILTSSDMKFIYVICELDVYCYCNEKQVWERGFSDIIVDYNIIDNEQIVIVCDDGRRYTLIMQNGELVY